MSSSIKQQCLANGIEFMKRKMAPIGLKGVRAIGSFLLKRAAVDIANAKDHILLWVASVTGLEFASRSGELVLQDWKSVWWNHVYDVLVVEFTEMKTRTKKTMPVVVSVHMETDWLFAMFCYIIINGGATSEYCPDESRERMFPNKEFEATKLNQRLNELRIDPSLQQLIPVDCTMKAFRVGKMNEITECPTGDLTLAMVRGGWQEKMRELFNIMEYWFETMKVAVEAARAGSGWANCKHKVFIPNIDCGLLSGEEKNMLYKLCDLLCHQHTHFSYRIPTMLHMQPIAYRMFAVFIVWFNDFIETYTCNHPIVQIVCTNAAKLDINLEMLKRFSSVLKSEWCRLNAAHVDSVHDIQPAIAAISQQMAAYRLEINELKSIVLSVLKDTAHIKNSIDISAVQSISPFKAATVPSANIDGLRDERPLANINDHLMKKRKLNSPPSFPTDNITEIIRIWYSHRFNENTKSITLKPGPNQNNGAGWIKRLMSFMDTYIITDVIKAKFTLIASIVDPTELSEAESRNRVVAEEVFKLFKKKYNDVIHDGCSKNYSLTLCSVERKLTLLTEKILAAKKKENIAPQQFVNNNMESEL